MNTIQQDDDDPLGIFGDSPEAIARWLALADSIPAPVLSDEEWEAMEARRLADREFEMAREAARERAATLVRQ